MNRTVSRRRVLQGGLLGGYVATAGCLSFDEPATEADRAFVDEITGRHAEALEDASYTLAIGDDVEDAAAGWADTVFKYDPGWERSVLGEYYQTGAFDGYVEQYFTPDRQVVATSETDDLGGRGIEIDDGPLVMTGTGFLWQYLLGAELVEETVGEDSPLDRRYRVDGHRDDDILGGHLSVGGSGAVRELEFDWLDDGVRRTARLRTTDIGATSVVLS